MKNLISVLVFVFTIPPAVAAVLAVKLYPCIKAARARFPDITLTDAVKACLDSKSSEVAKILNDK